MRPDADKDRDALSRAADALERQPDPPPSVHVSDARLSRMRETGAEELRKVASMIGQLSERFLDRFELEEIVTLVRAWRASEWDKYPDAEWTEEQIAAALRGVPPAWGSDEQPEDENGFLRFPALTASPVCPKCAQRTRAQAVDRIVRERRA